MLVMAKDKKKKPVKGRSISYRPSKDVEAALENFRNRYEFKPDRSEILERALRRFLSENGFKLPEPSDD